MNKKRQLRELQRFQIKLKSIYNNNRYFRRLYERNNKDNKNDEEEYMIISTGNGRNIFSEVPDGVIEFLNKRGHFDNELFDPENNIMSMGNYYDVLQTVKYLIDIIELDLTKAFIENDKYELLNDLKFS